MRPARFDRLLAGIGAVLLLSVLPQPARPQGAELPGGLYRATAIVTGTDMRQRGAGFADCLLQVLLKVTGQPGLRQDRAAAALTEHADQLVDRYAYVDPRAALLHHDDQGTYDRPHELTVWFRRDDVDEAVRRLGLHPWREPRPVLVPIVLVRTKEPEPFLLSAEAVQGAPLREALLRVALGYGVGVHFPTASELAEWGVDTIGSPNPVVSPDGGNRLVVLGTLSFNVKEFGWTGEWDADVAGAEHHWDVHGVGFDRAFQTMVDGAVELAAGTGVP